MKNYQAQTPQNLALSKILQKKKQQKEHTPQLTTSSQGTAFIFSKIRIHTEQWTAPVPSMVSVSTISTQRQAVPIRRHG